MIPPLSHLTELETGHVNVSNVGGHLKYLSRGPEVRDPGVDFTGLCRQVEAQLVQEEDEGLCLEAEVLGPVPRHQGDGPAGSVVVEGDGLVWEVRAPWQETVRVHLDPAGVQEDLLQPADEALPSLRQEDLPQCCHLGVVRGTLGEGNALHRSHLFYLRSGSKTNKERFEMREIFKLLQSYLTKLFSEVISSS